MELQDLMATIKGFSFALLPFISMLLFLLLGIKYLLYANCMLKVYNFIFDFYGSSYIVQSLPLVSEEAMSLNFSTVLKLLKPWKCLQMN